VSREPERDAGQACFREGLRFFGAITASVSHEINNVLAMISELSGLLEDNLRMAQQKGTVDHERMIGIVGRVAGQIDRGKGIVTGLNGFAHGVDHAAASLDLRDQVERICAICQRFARLKRSELVPPPGDATARLEGCPFTLQHLVYRGIEICLTTAGPDHPVAVEIEAEGGGARVSIAGGPADAGEAMLGPMVANLEALCAEAGGSVQVQEEAGQPLVVSMHLPHDMSRSSSTSHE
jgi:hypothetical protein